MVASLVAAVLTRQTLLLATSFGALAAVVLASDFAGSAVSPLVDHAVLELLGPARRGDYGKQRLYGAVGWGAASLAVGALAEAVGGADQVYLFSQLALMAAALAALAWLRSPSSTSPSASSPSSDPSPSPWIVARLLVTRADVAAFFLVVLTMGALMGQITTFLFLWLAELGGQETLFGVCLALTCVSEVPVFFFAGAIIARLGTGAVLALALATYAVRFVYYALLTQPWAVLPAELLHGLTYALSWAACTNYAAQIAPPGLGGTMQGVLAGVHWGLGQGVGAAVGGVVYDRWGARVSFFAAAGVATAALLLVGAAELVRRRRSRATTRTDTTL